MHTRTIVLAGRLLGMALAALALLALLALGVGPTLFGYRTTTVLTGSMRPSMPEGSLLVQTRVPLDRIGVGQVITYRIPVDDHRVVTHRVVEVVVAGDRPVVRTRGDANAAADPWLARLEGAHVWTTRLAVPEAGRAVQALRQPLARRTMVLVVPALLVLVWVRDIWATAGRRPAGGVPGPPAGPRPAVGRWDYGLVAVALVAVTVSARRTRRRAGLGRWMHAG